MYEKSKASEQRSFYSTFIKEIHNPTKDPSASNKMSLKFAVFVLVLSVTLSSLEGKKVILDGVLNPILTPTSKPNVFTLNQCAPAPVDDIIAINPCVCDCLYEHKAKNGLCNKNSQCICYYPDETNVTAALPLVATQCPQIVRQCYSDAEPLAKAGFEIGCNLDCMCTHGAPMGGTCDFENKFCRCNYTNVDKANADNAGCPAAFKDQILPFLKGFLEQATACALGSIHTPNELPNISCDTLLTYPVLVPAADATSCLEGFNLSALKDTLNTSILATLLPTITP